MRFEAGIKASLSNTVKEGKERGREKGAGQGRARLEVGRRIVMPLPYINTVI